MSLIPGVPQLDAIIQDNLLARRFHDSLYPELLFRSEAFPEAWEGSTGTRRTFTRASQLAVDTTPMIAGEDPAVESLRFEQWEAEAKQYGKQVKTHLPSSWAAIASTFARNAKQLGLNAGRVLNRLARDKLYTPYLGGHTVVSAATSSTAVSVAAINGFQTLIVDGASVPVSVTNPKAAVIAGLARNVTAAVPTDSEVPNGAGILTVDSSITVVVGDVALANDRPTIIRPANVNSIDGITANSPLTLAMCRRALATLERNNVPAFDDGYYHIHLDPLAKSQLFGDNEFQRINEGVPEGTRYQRFAVGKIVNAIFFSNTVSPGADNTGTQTTGVRTGAQTAGNIGAETLNASGVEILRSIVLGDYALMEKYVDEAAAYQSEGGIQGKVGQFQIMNNGIQIPIERVRYIIRAPQDVAQQNVSQAWTATLDFAVPSDLQDGRSSGRFKRAIVMESGLDQ